MEIKRVITGALDENCYILKKDNQNINMITKTVLKTTLVISFIVSPLLILTKKEYICIPSLI